MENYTIEVRVHCSLENARKLADLVGEFADSAVPTVDADVQLCDDKGNEIEDDVFSKAIKNKKAVFFPTTNPHDPNQPRPGAR